MYLTSHISLLLVNTVQLIPLFAHVLFWVYPYYNMHTILGTGIRPKSVCHRISYYSLRLGVISHVRRCSGLAYSLIKLEVSGSITTLEHNFLPGGFFDWSICFLGFACFTLSLQYIYTRWSLSACSCSLHTLSPSPAGASALVVALFTLSRPLQI